MAIGVVRGYVKMVFETGSEVSVDRSLAEAKFMCVIFLVNSSAYMM